MNRHAYASENESKAVEIQALKMKIIKAHEISKMSFRKKLKKFLTVTKNSNWQLFLLALQSVEYFLLCKGENFSSRFRSVPVRPVECQSCPGSIRQSRHECEKIVFADRHELGDNHQKTSFYKSESFMPASQGGRRESSESHG